MTSVCMDDGLLQGMVLPTEIHRGETSDTHSADASGMPSWRKCRNEIDIAFVALQQHFRYAGCAAEVSVYLERGM